MARQPTKVKQQILYKAIYQDLKYGDCSTSEWPTTLEQFGNNSGGLFSFGKHTYEY